MDNTMSNNKDTTFVEWVIITLLTMNICMSLMKAQDEYEQGGFKAVIEAFLNKEK